MRALLVMTLLLRAAAADELADIKTPACDAESAHCFAIHLHVAGDETGLVASADWIAAQLATANKHFKALDTAFQISEVDGLPASAVHLETRAHRDALGTRITGKVIHVFIVGELDDIDIQGAKANGVTWRRKTRKFIIVSAQAWDRTLAHELGHFFGLPHSAHPISIMNKTERDEPPQDAQSFADEEFAAMRATLKRFVRDKVVANHRR